MRLFDRRRWILPAVLLVCGCGDKALQEPEIDTSKSKADFGYQTSAQTAMLLEGKLAYGQYCVGCHGVNGDGKGEGSYALNPKPRDFVMAKFKFSSTRSGQLPTDEDLLRTITLGLRGSAMPSWNFVPEQTRIAMVQYIKTFSPKWKQFGEGARIPLYNDPYKQEADKTAAIERGRAAYHGFFRCWTCHPAYVEPARISTYISAFGGAPADTYRPDLHLADIKTTEAGESIFAPDFLRDFVRAGSTIPDLYRSIAAGITGTAMPTWVDIMDSPPTDAAGKPVVQPADLWAMSYYVQDLIKQRPPRFAAGKVAVRPLREITFKMGGAEYVAKVPQLDSAEEEE